MDAQIAYRIGRAVAQHFSAKKVVVGWDARQTSAEFADAVSSGIMDGRRCSGYWNVWN